MLISIFTANQEPSSPLTLKFTCKAEGGGRKTAPPNPSGSPPPAHRAHRSVAGEL